MACPDCGEDLIGDGYTSHIHCPYAEFEDDDCYEADANPVYCGFKDDLEIKEEIPTHIADIRSGDTVIHEGVIKTVCDKDMIRNTFMGTTLFGDSYCLGSKLVIKVII